MAPQHKLTIGEKIEAILMENGPQPVKRLAWILKQSMRQVRIIAQQSWALGLSADRDWVVLAERHDTEYGPVTDLEYAQLRADGVPAPDEVAARAAAVRAAREAAKRQGAAVQSDAPRSTMPGLRVYAVHHREGRRPTLRGI